MAFIRVEPVEVHVRTDWFSGRPREVTLGRRTTSHHPARRHPRGSGGLSGHHRSAHAVRGGDTSSSPGPHLPASIATLDRDRPRRGSAARGLGPGSPRRRTGSPPRRRPPNTWCHRAVTRHHVPRRRTCPPSFADRRTGGAGAPVPLLPLHFGLATPRHGRPSNRQSVAEGPIPAFGIRRCGRHSGSRRWHSGTDLHHFGCIRCPGRRLPTNRPWSGRARARRVPSDGARRRMRGTGRWPLARRRTRRRPPPDVPRGDDRAVRRDARSYNPRDARQPDRGGAIRRPASR